MCQLVEAFLYNWQTLIAGCLAVAAAISGGWLAYRAGGIQAQATREAAQKQLIANAKPVCVLMPFDGVDPWNRRDTLLGEIGSSLVRSETGRRQIEMPAT